MVAGDSGALDADGWVLGVGDAGGDGLELLGGGDCVGECDGVGFGEVDQLGVGFGVVGFGVGLAVGVGVGLGFGFAFGAFIAGTTRVAAKNSHHQIEETLTLSPAVGACTILLPPM